MGIEIVIILILILVNGFFSLSEMAIVSSRSARLRQRAEEGHKGAKLALETAEKPGKFLSTVQIVITLVGIIAGAYGGATVADEVAALFGRWGLRIDIGGPLAFTLVVVLTTFLSVVFGELVPKNLALARPEAIASFVAFPMRFFSTVFAPIVRVLTGATDLVLAAFRARHSEEPPVTEEEVKVLIAQGTETGIFDEREKEMFEGILYLGDKKVTAFMTPRTEIAHIGIEDPLPEAQEAVLRSFQMSYLPVVRGDLDHIEGIIRISKALAAIARGGMGSIADFIERPLLVPESMNALNLFTRFKQAGCRVAFILDEYGGVSGMVTFSDLVEAILGEIATSSGQMREPEVTEREDGSFLIDGSLSIDDFVDRFAFDASAFANEYETLAGFVLDRMGSIPKAGDSFRFGSWRLEVMDMDGNRVDKVLLSRLAEKAPQGGGT